MALRPDSPQSRSNQLAERSAGQGDAFLREVDDALREDQVYTAIQKYGKPVGALIVAGLLGLGGYLWYENHSNAKAAEQGEVLTKALDNLEVRNLKAATDAVAPLAAEGTDGYRATAKMLAAGVLSEQGKNAEAARAFAAIAADADIPQAYRDLATIREVSLTFDQLGPDKVVERLKPLAEFLVKVNANIDKYSFLDLMVPFGAHALGTLLGAFVVGHVVLAVSRGSGRHLRAMVVGR